MKVLFAVVALITTTACGKKVEAVPTPVNPQITDAVTQTTTTTETVDAGAVLQSVTPAPTVSPVK